MTTVVLPVTEEIADLSGRMIAASKKASHTAEMGDTLTAATASIHGLKVATLNRKHFQRLGAELVEF
jgi:predicted nucleic acid-binding protein